MKFKVVTIIRVVSPSHSIFISSFLLLLPSFSFTILCFSYVAFFLCHTLPLTTFFSLKLSLARPFFFTMSFSHSLSLFMPLFHLRVTRWSRTQQARHWRLVESKREKISRWRQPFNITNKSTQHCKGQHSTMLPQLLHC